MRSRTKSVLGQDKTKAMWDKKIVKGRSKGSIKGCRVTH